MEKPKMPVDFEPIELRKITDTRINSIVCSYVSQLSQVESEEQLTELLDRAVEEIGALSDGTNLEQILTAAVTVGQCALTAQTRIRAINLADLLRTGLEEICSAEVYDGNDKPKNPVLN